MIFRPFRMIVTLGTMMLAQVGCQAAPIAKPTVNTGLKPGSTFTVVPLEQNKQSKPSAPLILGKDGKALYTIALAADAIPAEITAASELANYLQRISGATFTIKPETEIAASEPQILVGAGPRVRSLVSLDWDGLSDDAIVLKTVGKNLILAGDRPRGTLYATYSLLEDVLGCRWWSSSEETVPKRATLSVPALDTVYSPPIKAREGLYKDAGTPEFVRRLKLNGHYYSLDEKSGGKISFIPELVHTFYKLLPPDKYFAEHPDWYSEINGKRIAGHDSQLCLTNPAMRAEITRVLLERLRTEKDPRLVSLSQNDTFGGNCQCPNCKAIDDREGTPAGTIVDFVNAVATDIEKEFPHVKVETLAYNYSRTPPKTLRPRDNVIIRLVGGIGVTYEQPLDSDANKVFRDQTEGWSAIAPNMFFWDYTTNFTNYLVPHPNLQVLAPNIRFFAKHHAWGVFAQGDSGSASGDFVRLKFWLISHLLWNPQLDDKKLRTEFMNGYYGKAGPFLDKFLDLQTAAFLKRDIRLTSSGAQQSYMSVAQMNEATELFEKAEKAVASDPVLVRRVRRERIPLDHIWLLRYADLKRIAAMEKLPFKGPQDPAVGVESIIERVRLEDKTDGAMYNEGMRFSAYEPMLRQTAVALKQPAPPPPAEAAGLSPNDWADIQNYQFTLQGGEPVDEPAASDGKATKPHSPWAIVVPLSGDLLEFWKGNWRVYVSAKVPGEDKGKGVAFSCGIYDYSVRDSTFRNIATNEVKGEGYQTYDLGTVKLNYNKAVWFTWENGNAKDVFIDRVFLVKDTAPATPAPAKP